MILENRDMEVMRFFCLAFVLVSIITALLEFRMKMEFCKSAFRNITMTGNFMVMPDKFHVNIICTLPYVLHHSNTTYQL